MNEGRCYLMVTDATMASPGLEQDWMTPEEFNDWFRRLKLIAPDFNQPELARRLDVPQPTISRWLSGSRRIEHGTMLRRALRDLAAELEQERKPRKRQARRGTASAGEEDGS
jgi:transcriptional regulator with XRE-family HTH domain